MPVIRRFVPEFFIKRLIVETLIRFITKGVRNSFNQINVFLGSVQTFLHKRFPVRIRF